MNTQNFASLEASKKLHDAGVKLKTDCVWCPKSLIPTQSEEWILITNARFNREYYDFDPCVPAPSMVEVWRELPDSTCINKDGDYTKCWVDSNMSLKVFQNENPTDALIDLLIWVKEKKQRTQ